MQARRRHNVTGHASQVSCMHSSRMHAVRARVIGQNERASKTQLAVDVGNELVCACMSLSCHTQSGDQSCSWWGMPPARAFQTVDARQAGEPCDRLSKM